jgi:hypothetical protein
VLVHASFRDVDQDLVRHVLEDDVWRGLELLTERLFPLCCVQQAEHCFSWRVVVVSKDFST